MTEKLLALIFLVTIISGQELIILKNSNKPAVTIDKF